MTGETTKPQGKAVPQWDDPNLMPLYHVQLETRDLIVSYDVATPDYNAVEVATADLRSRLRDPEAHIWKGGTSTIGYYAIGDGSPVVVSWSIAKGCEPKGQFKEEELRGLSVEADRYPSKGGRSE